MKQQIVHAILTFALAGCATSRPTPLQLVAARDAYHKAVNRPGAVLVAVDVHKAKLALANAEKAWAADDENSHVVDLSYIAQRRAELANALAEGAQAAQEQAENERAIDQSHADSAETTNRELDVARAQLADAQSQTKDALEQLKTLKGRTEKQEERGVVITLLGSVLFQSNKATLTPNAKGHLEDIAHALAASQGQEITIEGYTDGSGSKERNEQLSQQRAESVMSYLVIAGVPADKIHAVGHGPEKPIADNTSSDGRATNRRAEIVVRGEGKAPQGS